MGPITTEFLKSLFDQGPLFVALAIAVYYLKKSDDKQAAVNETLVALMNRERVERIAILEAHVVDCNKRHDDAQAKLERLLMRVAKLDHRGGED